MDDMIDTMFEEAVASRHEPVCAPQPDLLVSALLRRLSEPVMTGST